MKVYELAKELGTDSLSLLDQLKKLGVNVKSHMSGLEDSDVEKARESLAKKAPKKVAKKKKVASKKTVSTKPKGSVRKRKSASDDSATETQEAAPKRKAANTVIRRRKGPEVETSEEHSSTPDFEPERQEAASFNEANEAGSNIAKSETPTTEMTADAPATKSAPVKREAAASNPIKQPAAAKAAAEQTKARLKFVKVDEAKSLLKVIKLPEKQSARTEAGAQKKETGGEKSPRVFKMTKEALDKMVEDEAKKKRGGTDKPVRPEDVRFNDYRKKEIIFLPKRKRIPTGRELKRTQITTPAAHKRIIEMGDSIVVSDLANQMGIKAPQLMKKLISMGQMVNIHQPIDFDTATLVATEFGYEIKDITFKEEDYIDSSKQDSADDLSDRPPIVTVMGHVDHGKTSLLDAIKDSRVAEKEAGGITQHIGAYTIENKGKLITFIDTPGHEAFSVMRARGANVTDIVVLVVAADDGVMPQTREAISHAQAAGVPIIVAINKMDTPGANPEKVKQVLSELNLLAEDWGGETIFVPVSAKERTNIDQLIESIQLVSEMQELKANPDASASGVVLEARLEKGKGPVGSLLVMRGTLRVGDSILCGEIGGRVRAMLNHLGQTVKVVGPGMAAEVSGMSGVPNAGDQFDAPRTDEDMKVLIEQRTRTRQAKEQVNKKMTLEELFAKVEGEGLKELKVVLKADVYGSVEAVKDSLEKASTEKVKVNVIHSATGGITESDVLLASASNAIIIGFNVRPETKAIHLAQSENVEIKTYNIIYELIDDIKKAMVGLLEKTKVEKFLGRAEVRQTFSVPKIGTIAGSAVIDGKLLRNSHVRLLRDSKIIFEGKLSSLKRFKDDAKEVQTGYECGIGIENYNDLKAGDIIEAFEIELITPDL